VDSSFLILSGAGARWTRDFLKNFLILDPLYLACGAFRKDADTFYVSAAVWAIA
jgi:hypothetical protein